MSSFNLKTNNSKSGYIALVSVLIISAVIVVIAISVALLSISEGQLSLAEVKSQTSLDFVDACAEDVLLRINNDETYSGGTLSLPQGDCTVVVNSAGTDFTVTVEGTLDGYRKKVELKFTRVPPNLNLTSWVEVE